LRESNKYFAAKLLAMDTKLNTERRSSGDRRLSELAPPFPFFDSEQTLVRENSIIPLAQRRSLRIIPKLQRYYCRPNGFMWANHSKSLYV